MRKLIKISVFFCLVSIAFAPSAHAYIDMGTGSYVLQVVLAGLVSVGVALRIFWGRIKSYFLHKDNEE